MQRARVRTAAVLATTALLASGLLAGCTSTNSAGSGASSAAVPGVTSKDITLGALIPLTGAFAAGAKASLVGVNLYWDSINASGGVCGRDVKVIARDTAYDPQKTVTAYAAVNTQILGIQLLTGTPTTEAVLPQLSQDDMVAVPMSWSPDLLGKSSLPIPGATYDVDMMNAVDYLLKTGDLKKGDTIGYIYFQGDFGSAGLAGAQYAAKIHDITVDPYQVDPTVTDLSSQVSQMATAHTSAIFISASPPLLANAAALSHTDGLDVPIVVPTPTYVPQLLASPAADQIAGRTIVVSSYNAWTADAPGIKELRAAFKKSGETSDPQQFDIAGYSAANLMHGALTAACKNGPLTRASLKKAFAAIDGADMNGLSVDVSYRDRTAPPSLEDYILKADKNAVGGLTPLLDEPYKGADTKPLLKGK